MIAVMQKAVTFDEGDINRERERFNKLATENKVCYIFLHSRVS